MTDCIRAFLAACGDNPDDLTCYRELGDGTYVLAKPLMFHWTVIRGYVGDTFGYFDRWCFATEALARAALAAFPNTGGADHFDPPGWHRHPGSGRRRPDGNPALEYIDR